MKRLITGLLTFICGLALLAGCGGSSSDTPTTTPSVERIVISDAYLQHRTYPNPNFNHLRAWVELTKNGTPITAGDVNANGVTLRDPSGTALVPAVAPAFREDSVLGATWDISAGAFGATEVVAWGGFTLDFSNYPTLPAGDYTFEVDIGTGTPLSYTFNYPGMATAALVDIATMDVTEVVNDAIFTWTEPTGTLDQYRIVLTNQDDREIFYARVPAGVDAVTFTPAMKAALDVFDPNITALNWQMQGRLYTAANMNYARSKSAFFSIPLDGDPGPGIQISTAYLQHRTYPNSSFNHLRAWVELTKDGSPITASDVNANGVTLRNPSGIALVPAAVPGFYDDVTLYATWDVVAGAFGPTSIVSWGGFSLDLSNYATLPAGDYTFEVDVGTGTPLSYTFSYPGMATAALVDIATMSLTDNPDNTATFMWTEPVGDLDEYRLILTNQDDSTVFYGRVPAGVTSVIFTPSMKVDLDALDPTFTALNWQMDGRLYTLERMNYARSKSAFFSIPLD